MADWYTVNASIVVERGAEDCYAVWRKLENLPNILANVESVVQTSDRQSHWVVEGPAGARVEWDAQITADEPGREIGWTTIGDSDVKCMGTVRFEPAGDNACTVSVNLRYLPPAGVVGEVVATLFGVNPDKQIRHDLERFRYALAQGTFGQRTLAAGGQAL